MGSSGLKIPLEVLAKGKLNERLHTGRMPRVPGATNYLCETLHSRGDKTEEAFYLNLSSTPSL
jgi:hypothetical protein